MFKYQLLKIIPSLITLLNFGVIYAGFEWLEPEKILLKNGEQMTLVTSVNRHEGQVALGDWDGDGDPDIITFGITDQSGKCQFLIYENSGTAEKYTFEQPKKLSGINISSRCVAQGLQIIDMDNDGYPDLTFVEAENGVQFYKGDGSENLVKAETILDDLISGIWTMVSPSSYLGDHDNDSDNDLFWVSDRVYESDGLNTYLEYYENIGTNSSHMFSIDNVIKCKNNAGEVLKIKTDVVNVSMSDVEGDGDLDLFIFQMDYLYVKNAGLEYVYTCLAYSNEGDLKFELKDTLVSEMNVQVRGTTGDLNNDGVVDLIILKGKNLFVSWGKGLTDLANKSSLVLKSRPSIHNNTLVLSKDVKNNPAEIALISTNGRTIANIKTSLTHTDLGKLSSVSRGMYIVNVKFNNKKYSLLWNKVSDNI